MERKIIAYIAASLDGYVADVDGDVAWLSGDGSDEGNFGSFPEFIETVDTVILGYTTYHQIVNYLSKDKWPYKGKISYVLTSKNLESQDDIKFTNTDIKELVEKIKRQPGKDIWICGGASIINQFHNLNLIDIYTVSVIPTILGKGTKLFKEYDSEIKLKLVSTREYNGIVDLTYNKR